MPGIRRYYIPNATVFITNVTRDRTPILISDSAIDAYWQTLERVQAIYPFELIAFVILPDHFHWLLNISSDDSNFSKILHSFKRNFTLNYKSINKILEPLKFWQDRFWDHIIRDEKDLGRHLDYIHWNPVKHGFVDAPEKWEYSSYYEWYRLDYYDEHWGKQGEPQSVHGMNLE